MLKVAEKMTIILQKDICFKDDGHSVTTDILYLYS